MNQGYAPADYVGKPLIAIINTWSVSISATRISSAVSRM